MKRVLEHQGVGDALPHRRAQGDGADDARTPRLELDLVVLVLARRLVREHDLKTLQFHALLTGRLTRTFWL